MKHIITATITIGPGTEIDLPDLVQSRLLIQGNSGSGKSGVARVIIEKTFGIIPFVVWDIEGEYYTLKELSGDIIIIGGQHADVPLTMELAEKLPAFIIKNGLNVVVDLSDMKMHQRIEFTKIFFETLMDLPMEYWTSYFFFLEECHKLAGEQDKQESATSIKDLMQRGRKRGFCGVPITQRISMLNKSVAAECNNKFIGRTNLDLDMDRSAKELGFSKAADRLKLRDLPRKHFYAYGTSITPQHVHEIVIEDARTTMPKQGMKLNFKPEKPTVKLLEMLAKLNETEKVKPAGKNIPQNRDDSEEVSALREEVGRLQDELIKADSIQRETAILAETRGIVLNRILSFLVTNGNEIHELLSMVKNSENSEVLSNTDLPQNGKPNIARASGMSIGVYREPIKKSDSPNKVLADDPGKERHMITKNTGLATGEIAVLTACRQYQGSGGIKRNQLCIMTGYKRSSINTYLQRLSQRKYVEEAGNSGRFYPTKEGVNKLGDKFEPLPTGKALQNYWVENLPEGESIIFSTLVRHKNKTISRQYLEEVTEYKRSSINTYLQRLSSREIIETGKEGVKASDFLFD